MSERLIETPCTRKTSRTTFRYFRVREIKVSHRSQLFCTMKNNSEWCTLSISGSWTDLRNHALCSVLATDTRLDKNESSESWWMCLNSPTPQYQVVNYCLLLTYKFNESHTFFEFFVEVLLQEQNTTHSILFEHSNKKLSEFFGFFCFCRIDIHWIDGTCRWCVCIISNRIHCLYYCWCSSSCCSCSCRCCWLFLCSLFLRFWGSSDIWWEFAFCKFTLLFLRYAIIQWLFNIWCIIEPKIMKLSCNWRISSNQKQNSIKCEQNKKRVNQRERERECKLLCNEFSVRFKFETPSITRFQHTDTWKNTFECIWRDFSFFKKKLSFELQQSEDFQMKQNICWTWIEQKKNWEREGTLRSKQSPGSPNANWWRMKFRTAINRPVTQSSLDKTTTKHQKSKNSRSQSSNIHTREKKQKRKWFRQTREVRIPS